MSSEPRLLPRDYIASPTYALFEGGARAAQSRAAVIPAQPSVAAVQTNVLPFSEADLSSAGSVLYLTWLYDDPNRSAINRTVAMFSSWDGSSWRYPTAIADDGTADFHPQIQTLSDGSAVAVWENHQSVLADSTSFDQLADLDVVAAFYDPATDRWTTPQALTANDILDRSPRARGTSHNDVIVTWIENASMTGSQTIILAWSELGPATRNWFGCEVAASPRRPASL